MKSRLLVGLSITLTLILSSGMSLAQDPAPVDTMWMDLFDDTDQDSAGFFNVGWIRFGEEDGLTNSIVRQTADGYLYMLSGNFQIVGAVVAETNGLPFINPLDLEATDRLLKQNNFSHPNQVITFQFNLFNMRPGSVLILATRMVQQDTADFLPVADPTESPAYALLIDPNTNTFSIGKYAGPFAALNPKDWAYFGMASFEFEGDIWYWAKFYLHEGKLRAKIWEGEMTDEPMDWMIAAEDTAPRVTGRFTMFAILGAPPGGDEVYIDNVLVQGFGDLTPVEPIATTMPTSFALEQNYPNPFNPETFIQYSLVEKALTRLEIYNLMGQRVRTLVAEVQPPGTYRIRFDGRNDNGNLLPSGVYLYRLTSGKQVLMKKMLFVK